MSFRIAKEFRWEMSHRLPFHEGLCRNIHGHSYRLRVEVEGTKNASDMVLDFYEMEKIVQPVINKLDHSFLCDSSDKELIDFLSAGGYRFNIIQNYTTAENIADFILNDIADSFARYKNIDSLIVRVYETEDAFAEKQLSLREGDLK